MTGNELKAMRIKAGVTQAGAAKVIDVTKNHYQKYEYDIHKMHPLFEKALLEFFRENANKGNKL